MPMAIRTVRGTRLNTSSIGRLQAAGAPHLLERGGFGEPHADEQADGDQHDA